MMPLSEFNTKPLPREFDYLAPDGSEIRLLLDIEGGGLAHCTLPTGKVSLAVYHKTVEELWYFLSGVGEVWRKQEDREETLAVQAGVCLSIPIGTSFQFRNTGKEPLCFVITTMPPWPGEDEAVPTDGNWSATI